MTFGDIPLSDAVGAILAHSLRTNQGLIRKGTRLSDQHIGWLKKAGHESVLAAVLASDDIDEDEAAGRLADALCGYGLKCSDASTGRANLHSTRDGLLLIDYDRINRINILDERITIATLEPFASVSPRQLAATIKIIPYAVPEFILTDAIELTEGLEPVLRVKNFRPKKTALLMSKLSDADDKLLEKGRQATRERLARFGSTIGSERTVLHAAADIAGALVDLCKEAPDLILILGATAIADRSDIVPSAIIDAGGKIEQFGMPVDPGNLLLFGDVGGTRIVGIPGCARSPKLNGFDWVLERLHADLTITSRDIARMGVGGLLKEIPSRPQPRDVQSAVVPEAERKVYAIVLAAGQSRRMGKQNKLLATLDEKPLIHHVIDALTGSSVEEIYVVTGHESEDVRQLLSDRRVELVHNPAYASGLSSSLRVGIAALPSDADAVLVCLGDMPLIRTDTINALVSAYTKSPAETICIPAYRGKHGNPVLWPRCYFSEIMELTGDVGARALVGLHENSVLSVSQGSDSVLVDVDTREVLHDLERSSPLDDQT